MSDIFREVDEELRREQLKRLWDRYQNLVIGAALLVILGVGGWRGYEWWEARRAAEAGGAFEAAITLAASGKHEEAAAAFGKIAKDGTASYRNLALLRQAAEVTERDPKAGAAAYEQIAGNRDVEPLLRELATLRAAAIHIDLGNYETVRKLLQPMAEPGRNFRHTARELLALSAWRAGDSAGLKRWIETIVKDPETPLAMRNRVNVLVALSADQSKG
ncbi:MAG: tetratricopeptide repeat protein [Xanthobacteraceae bacterium]